MDVNFELRLSSSANVNVTTPGAGDVSSSRISSRTYLPTRPSRWNKATLIIESLSREHNTDYLFSACGLLESIGREFTNLFTKMNQQHTEQLEADRTNTEDMIAAEESNTTNIINNNNANTDKLAQRMIVLLGTRRMMSWAVNWMNMILLNRKF
ncbi:MAG: hypothetical protein ACLTW9_05755 [Enterocloster sp.]